MFPKAGRYWLYQVKLKVFDYGKSDFVWDILALTRQLVNM